MQNPSEGIRMEAYIRWFNRERKNFSSCSRNTDFSRSRRSRSSYARWTSFLFVAKQGIRQVRFLGSNGLDWRIYDRFISLDRNFLPQLSNCQILIRFKAAQKAQIDAYKKGMFDTLPACYTTDFMKLTIEGSISPMENIELLKKYGYPDDSSPIDAPYGQAAPSNQITEAVATELQKQIDIPASASGKWYYITDIYDI